ncbi:hypothetical protein [Halocola ammonii]
MKRIFALCLISTFVFAGCSKYEEGPKISLRTRTERLSNMWDYDKLEVANEDRTDEVLGATMELQKDGDWNQRNGLGELVALGNWEWEDDQETVRLNYEIPGETIEPLDWKIIKLEEHQLIVEYTFEDNYVYIEFGD